MTVAISIMFFACSLSVEQDAKHLATLQQDRTANIKMMLQIDDTLQLSTCRQKLMEITTEYEFFKNEMEIKYNSANEWARFETAYRKALE